MYTYCNWSIVILQLPLNWQQQKIETSKILHWIIMFLCCVHIGWIFAVVVYSYFYSYSSQDQMSSDFLAWGWGLFQFSQCKMGMKILKCSSLGLCLKFLWFKQFQTKLKSHKLSMGRHDRTVDPCSDVLNFLCSATAYVVCLIVCKEHSEIVRYLHVTCDLSGISLWLERMFLVAFLCNTLFCFLYLVASDLRHFEGCVIFCEFGLD